MRNGLAAVAVGIASIVLTAPAYSAEGEPPASPEVTAAIQPYLDQYKLAGIIGVIADRDGKVHYKNLLGYADVEAKKPIGEDNVFWIASMSKMFAGASIMMLVDEGKVSLDDPVAKFIPQLNKWGSSGNRVGGFQSFGSMQVRILRRKYSSSR
jgi:CubicO group peptidase (beta-lactamase class C family)